MNNRIHALDLCRVVAVFGVICIHASAILLKPWGIYGMSDWLNGANLIDSFSRFSVPLFVMVSGALIIQPNNSNPIFATIFKRIMRVLIPLLIWEILLKWYFDRTLINLKDILVEPPKYHFWFIYMIIGIYLLIPMYQAIFDYIVNRTGLQIYLFILWFIFSSASTIYNPPLLTLIGQNNLLYFGGYFLMGPILMQYHWRKAFIPCLLIFIASNAYITLEVERLSLNAGVLNLSPYSNFNPYVLFAATAAFIGLNSLNISGFVANWLTKLSDLAFLMYFIHVIFIELLGFSITISHLASFLPVACIVLMVAIGTFLLCIVTSACLRLIPHSKIFLG